MLWWLVQNAVLAALLAGIVALICRLTRLRPAVRHALWLLVLIKLVTPPLVHWPWPPSVWRHFQPEPYPTPASFRDADLPARELTDSPSVVEVFRADDVSIEPEICSEGLVQEGTREPIP